MLYFATSLAYLKENGFPIVLHTDSKGMELFKDFPYDEIYTTLDNIPENINPKFYAYGKFLAMQKEELGSVHIDGDVFIKTKELGDRILNFKGKSITQGIESERTVLRLYRKWDFDECSDTVEKYVSLDTKVSYNCGVVGISDKELKDNYINSYINLTNELVDYKFESPFAIPDLVCEQLLLYYLNPDSDLVLETNTIEEMHRKNYLHVIGGQKMDRPFIENLKRVLQELNPKIYNLWQNI